MYMIVHLTSESRFSEKTENIMKLFDFKGSDDASTLLIINEVFLLSKYDVFSNDCNNVRDILV